MASILLIVGLFGSGQILDPLRKARLQSAPKAGPQPEITLCKNLDQSTASLPGSGKCAEKADGLSGSSASCMSGGWHSTWAW